MPVLLQSSINQHDLSINQDVLYVYLDNEQKKGGNNYAILMRNYSNTIGLIVKEKPSDAEKSYWSDSIFPSKRELLEEGLQRIHTHLRKGGIVVLTCDWSDDENLEKYSYKTYDYLLESIGTLRTRYSKTIDS
jgi:hypothetical protein